MKVTYEEFFKNPEKYIRDFVILCGYCSTFHGICIAVGLVGGYR